MNAISDNAFNLAVDILRAIAAHQKTCQYSASNPAACLTAVGDQAESILRLLGANTEKADNDKP